MLGWPYVGLTLCQVNLMPGQPYVISTLCRVDLMSGRPYVRSMFYLDHFRYFKVFDVEVWALKLSFDEDIFLVFWCHFFQHWVKFLIPFSGHTGVSLSHNMFFV